jgi:nucleoside-diphosphate-sugar epimerase
MSIFLTGSSGFVGQILVSAINPRIPIKKYYKGDEFRITENIVIHLAGKAHDLKKTANSDEYYQINTELTKNVFDAFLLSNAKVFITLSSVKAVADEVEGELTENQYPNPVTHYGKSKHECMR